MKINYTNKVTVNSLPNVSIERKFTSDDANEIKTKHNSLVDYAINLNSRVTTETNNLSSRINNNLNAINNINSVNSQQNTNISNNQSSISSLRNTISSLENRIRTLENRPSSGFRIRIKDVKIHPKYITWRYTNSVEVGIRLAFRRVLWIWTCDIDQGWLTDANIGDEENIICIEPYIYSQGGDDWKKMFVAKSNLSSYNPRATLFLNVYSNLSGNDDWENYAKQNLYLIVTYIERY